MLMSKIFLSLSLCFFLRMATVALMVNNDAFYAWVFCQGGFSRELLIVISATFRDGTLLLKLKDGLLNFWRFVFFPWFFIFAWRGCQSTKFYLNGLLFYYLDRILPYLEFFSSTIYSLEKFFKEEIFFNQLQTYTLIVSPVWNFVSIFQQCYLGC